MLHGGEFFWQIIPNKHVSIDICQCVWSHIKLMNIYIIISGGTNHYYNPNIFVITMKMVSGCSIMATWSVRTYNEPNTLGFDGWKFF